MTGIYVEKRFLSLVFLLFTSVAKGGHVSSPTPKSFLEYSQEDGVHRLIYSILNETKDSIKVVGDLGFLHHSNLNITKDGINIKGFNITRNMSMPIESTYLTLNKLVIIPPGEKFKIKQLILHKSESKSYDFEWGPTHFNLQPGQYQLQVVLPSIDNRHYSDSKWVKDEMIITSKLNSNTVKINLD
jgi:hypothetical protein